MVSKTKAGATLMGLGFVIGTVGGWLYGSIDTMNAIQALITEIGAVLAIYGIRDIPFLNSY